MEDLAALITHEVGMPLVLSQLVQVGLPMASFGAMAQVAADFTWEQTIGNSLVVREPIGVVGCITPWNYPLHQIAAKVAPALAAGCTVVLKPSEVAPLNAFVLAEIFEQVGLPAGVFNLVTGFGPVVGEAIASHPAWTWSRSPARPGPGGGCPSWPRPPSSGSPSNWGASRPMSSSTTPTWPWPFPTGFASATSTPGRPVAP